MTRSVGVAILGATGYGAGELLRYFLFHPEVEVVSVCSSSSAGVNVSHVHPHLRGHYDLSLVAEPDWSRLGAFKHAILFSTLPHGHSSATVKLITRAHPEVCCIDLSGDLRLSQEAVHRENYPETDFDAAWRKNFVYGLPEICREQLRTARHVANPGCLASATILGLAPLVGRVSGQLAVTAQTGSSGSGRSLRETTHHPARHADVFAYKVQQHPHEPEILQALGLQRNDISFVTQSLPVSRGIYVTVQGILKNEVPMEEVSSWYQTAYLGSPAVRIVSSPPHISAVVGTNYCDLSLHLRGKQVVCLVALDNLGKGMAGQAIQNMNLLCGLEEGRGLSLPALGPVLS